MQLSTILQIIFIFVIFAINLIFVLLPLKIIPRDPSKIVGTKPLRIITFCNCFSGGVFLGVCFLQLTPYINEKLQDVFILTDSNPMLCLPTTQCIIVLGFFLILVTEQGVRVLQGGHNKLEVEEAETEVIHVPTIPQHAWVPSSSDMDTGSTGSEESDDNSSGHQEKKHMLRHKSKKKSGKRASNSEKHKKSSILKEPGQVSFSAKDPPRVTFSTEEHHTTHGHSHAGHGHSHLGDILSDHFGLRCILLLMALSLHSFFEGLAVGLQDEVSKLVNIFVGVAVHECLVAFAIGINLAQQKLRLSTVVKLSLFFSATIPVGMLLGLVIGTASNSLAGQISSVIIQGIAAGTFYYVIFLEILPSEFSDEKDRLWKVLFLFVGYGIITALTYSIEHHH